MFAKKLGEHTKRAQERKSKNTKLSCIPGTLIHLVVRCR